VKFSTVEYYYGLWWVRNAFGQTDFTQSKALFHKKAPHGKKPKLSHFSTFSFEKVEKLWLSG